MVRFKCAISFVSGFCGIRWLFAVRGDGRRHGPDSGMSAFAWALGPHGFSVHILGIGGFGRGNRDLSLGVWKCRGNFRRKHGGVVLLFCRLGVCVLSSRGNHVACCRVRAQVACGDPSFRFLDWWNGRRGVHLLIDTRFICRCLRRNRFACLWLCLHVPNGAGVG